MSALADSPAGPRAVVTLVTTDSFIPGAQALFHSLRVRSPPGPGAAYTTHVMVTPAVTAAARAKLKGMADVVEEVEPIWNPHTAAAPEAGAPHVAAWGEGEYGYSKLRLWELTRYAKVLYLDADAIALAPVAGLFERLDRVAFAAAPDVFPPDKFNAGVLLLRPDRAVLEAMLAVAPTLPAHDGSDTGFLNSFFDTWWTSSADARLPFGYNAQRTLHWMTHDKNPGYWEAVAPLAVVHYSSQPKPWDAPGRKAELEMLWWQVYTDSMMPGMGTWS